MIARQYLRAQGPEPLRHLPGAGPEARVIPGGHNAVSASGLGGVQHRFQGGQVAVNIRQKQYFQGDGPSSPHLGSMAALRRGRSNRRSTKSRSST